MTLREFEEQLSPAQLKAVVPDSQLNKWGISALAIRHLKDGDNYRLSTLFDYLEHIGYLILADKTIAEDQEMFGQLLRYHRESMHLTMSDVSRRTSLSLAQVQALEKGKGSSRKALEQYLSVVPVDLDMVNMIDVFLTN